eukprot:12935961-Prorocentrum_lima.AAC.1
MGRTFLIVSGARFHPKQSISQGDLKDSPSLLEVGQVWDAFDGRKEFQGDEGVLEYQGQFHEPQVG